MPARKVQLLLIAGLLTACGRVPVSAETKADAAPYAVVREAQDGALLKVDWRGEGRELASGDAIQVSNTDARRMTFVSINFMARAPMQWRSTLERRLKMDEVSSTKVLTEPIEGRNLVRAYLSDDQDSGDFFFRKGVGADFSGEFYVAQCSTPFPWEKGAIHCTTQVDVETFIVEIRFDKAFLWDFENLQSRAVAAAKDYIARPSTQRSIKSIPRVNLP